MTADLSIVIVSYNQFEATTGICLDSLAAVQDIELQIILVDNGSEPETVEQLKLAARNDSRISLLLHNENRGFAAGNNDGVALAEADYILLLNSDTLVPGDVPGRLVRQLKTEQGVCLIGPVTNAAGNEQQIYLRGNRDQASVLAQGEEWANHARGSIILTDQLSFFCIAMAKETYLAQDGLDEVFGLGFYEDADFCCRAAERGVRLLILEDCFVFHQGSASFSKMPDSVKELLANNRKLFRSRHGRGEGEHVRLKNLRVLKQYLDRGGQADNALNYLAKNRLARARQLVPRNPVKKIMYAARLRRLEKSICHNNSCESV